MPRVPSLFTWLVLAALCCTMPGCKRPAPLAATPAASAAMPSAQAATQPPAAPREPGPYESPRPAAPQPATPLPDLSEVAPGEPAPKAGRQVLRCTAQGRITYLDLNASCPEGPGERVTVFPTEGVEKPH
jgi:hypothetical protein